MMGGVLGSLYCNRCSRREVGCLATWRVAAKWIETGVRRDKGPDHLHAKIKLKQGYLDRCFKQ